MKTSFLGSKLCQTALLIPPKSYSVGVGCGGGGEKSQDLSGQGGVDSAEAAPGALVRTEPDVQRSGSLGSETDGERKLETFFYPTGAIILSKLTMLSYLCSTFD